MVKLPEPLFPLGQIVGTPACMEALYESKDNPADFLTRHVTGDWGDVCAEDAELNNQAVTGGSRVLSAYQTSKGVKFWIITEADRASTCLLLPEEY